MKFTSITKKSLIVLSLFLPAMMVFAQPVQPYTGVLGTITQVLNRFGTLINFVIPFIIGLAVFVILWGIFTYITHSAEEEKRAQAKSFIVWGIIGVFCMLSFWGFVNILSNSIDLDTAIDSSQFPKAQHLEP